jgi:hypothetical protein
MVRIDFHRVRGQIMVFESADRTVHGDLEAGREDDSEDERATRAHYLED